MAEKAMAPHSSPLAWNIPCLEEPGGLQSMVLLRVGHDWATSLSLFTFMHWRRKWQENPRDRGAWWAAVHGVTQSRTRLKRLSSSSSPTGIHLLEPGIGSLSPEPMRGLKLVQVSKKTMLLRHFLVSHIHPQRKDVSILSTTQVLKLEGERR